VVHVVAAGVEFDLAHVSTDMPLYGHLFLGSGSCAWTLALPVISHFHAPRVKAEHSPCVDLRQSNTERPPPVAQRNTRVHVLTY
jgi:hypothetical protein